MTFKKFLETFDKKKLCVQETIETFPLHEYDIRPIDELIFELQSIKANGYADVSIKYTLDYSGCYYESDTPDAKLEVIGYKEETDKQYLERAKRHWKNQKR